MTCLGLSDRRPGIKGSIRFLYSPTTDQLKAGPDAYDYFRVTGDSSPIRIAYSTA
jgi:hypothetical protein